MPTLALLDGHSLAYRAFYALPSDLATPAGQVTNAVFGFTSMLIKLLGEEHPDAVAVAWDTPEATFRSEEYPEYKAGRTAAPDLFKSQLPLIEEVAEALHLTQFRVPGFEADDVIATIATESAAAGWQVLVVTGDREIMEAARRSDVTPVFPDLFWDKVQEEAYRQMKGEEEEVEGGRWKVESGKKLSKEKRRDRGRIDKL